MARNKNADSLFTTTSSKCVTNYKLVTHYNRPKYDVKGLIGKIA